MEWQKEENILKKDKKQEQSRNKKHVMRMMDKDPTLSVIM